MCPNTLGSFEHTALFMVTSTDAPFSVAQHVTYAKQAVSATNKGGLDRGYQFRVHWREHKSPGGQNGSDRMTSAGPLPKEGPTRSQKPEAMLTSRLDYERFNSSNISIRSWSWNYRGCWHQTDPPVDTHCSVCVASIANRTRRMWQALLPFFVAASLMRWYWAIYAPAASLSCGSRLSGSLSGIEPRFPVTRHSHCGPLHHNRKLIGQKLARECSNALRPLCYHNMQLP